MAEERTALTKSERQEWVGAHMARIEVADAYFGFVASKLIGLGCVVTGAAKLVLPVMATVAIAHPGALVGFGVTLLVGKRGVAAIAKGASRAFSDR